MTAPVVSVIDSEDGAGHGLRRERRLEADTPQPQDPSTALFTFVLHAPTSGAVRIDRSHFFDAPRSIEIARAAATTDRRDVAADERARHPLRRPGDADRGDDVAGVVTNRRGDAADALLALFFVEAVAALADLDAALSAAASPT